MVAFKSLSNPLIVLFALYRMAIDSNNLNGEWGSNSIYRVLTDHDVDFTVQSSSSSPSKSIFRSEYQVSSIPLLLF